MLNSNNYNNSGDDNRCSVSLFSDDDVQPPPEINKYVNTKRGNGLVVSGQYVHIPSSEGSSFGCSTGQLPYAELELALHKKDRELQECLLTLGRLQDDLTEKHKENLRLRQQIKDAPHSCPSVTELSNKVSHLQSLVSDLIRKVDSGSSANPKARPQRHRRSRTSHAQKKNVQAQRKNLPPLSAVTNNSSPACRNSVPSSRVFQHPPSYTTRNSRPVSPSTLRSNLVIGDSMVKHTTSHLPKDEYSVLCHPGIRINQLTDKVVGLQAHNAGALIIHVGTNDLKKSQDNKNVVTDFTNLIAKVKSQFPHLRICLSAVIHRRDIRFQRISALNESLKWLCETTGCEFIDANSQLCDYDLGKDGLHLNRRGSRTLASVFKGSLETSKNP